MSTVNHTEVVTKITIGGITLHLNQVVSHKLSRRRQPVYIESEWDPREKIYNERLDWVVTSLNKGVTLSDPQFENEVLYYTYSQLKNEEVKIEPKTAEDNKTPIIGYPNDFC